MAADDTASKGVNAPDVYRKMLEPFASVEDMDKAIAAFNDDLRDIRIKHKIPDVVVLYRVTTITSSGEEGAYSGMASHGSPHEREGLLAGALGAVQMEREETIAKALLSTRHRKGKTS